MLKVKSFLSAIVISLLLGPVAPNAYGFDKPNVDWEGTNSYREIQAGIHDIETENMNRWSRFKMSFWPKDSVYEAYVTYDCQVRHEWDQPNLIYKAIGKVFIGGYNCTIASYSFKGGFRATVTHNVLAFPHGMSKNQIIALFSKKLGLLYP